MATIVKTLGELIDSALLELQDPAEQGLMAVLSWDPLTTTTDTTFSLQDPPAVNTSDLIEFGSELVLVTGKSSDADPTFLASRGYFGTTKAVHPEGTVGIVNPQWPRVRVAEGVKRSLPRLEAMGVPLTKSATFNRVAGEQHVLLDDDVRKVLLVRYIEQLSGRVFELDRWNFLDNVPTTKFAGGKILTLGGYVADVDDLEVTYRATYRWSSYPDAPTEADTIELPEGAEDLPATYAAAWIVERREISRSDIDRSEEWNRTEPIRNGAGLGLARSLWQAFYRALDEIKRLHPEPARRPYLPMMRIR